MNERADDDAQNVKAGDPAKHDDAEQDHGSLHFDLIQRGGIAIGKQTSQ